MRLTPFEEFLFWQDSLDYPCWIVAHVALHGKLRRDALEQALAEMGKHQPRLRSIVVRRLTGLYWQELADWKTSVSWYSGPLENGLPPLEPLDIRRFPGFRFVAWEEGNKSGFLFHFHHAICDGKGLQDLFSWLAEAYESALGGRGCPSLPETVPKARSSVPVKWISRAIALGVALRAQLTKVAPLVAQVPGPEGRRRYPAVAKIRLDAAEIKRLGEAARQRGVTMNDLMVGELQTAIHRWWHERGVPVAGRHLRVLLPVSLRRPSRRPVPLANETGMVSTDCGIEEGDFERRLREIQADMQWVRSGLVSRAFLDLLSFSRLVPGGLRWMSRSPWLFRGTILFSNLGKHGVLRHDRQFRMGEAVIEDFTMAGPLRPGVPASVMAMKYAGRLFLDLHYDLRAISTPEAEQLAEILAAGLKGGSKDVACRDGCGGF